MFIVLKMFELQDIMNYFIERDMDRFLKRLHRKQGSCEEEEITKSQTFPKSAWRNSKKLNSMI